MQRRRQLPGQILWRYCTAISSSGIWITDTVDFVSWCDKNYLDLNLSKTKELIIDFRCDKNPAVDSTIHGKTVERVTSYKYLGTFFDEKLKFDVNTADIVKRGQQRIHLLCKLNSFSVSPVIVVFISPSSKVCCVSPSSAGFPALNWKIETACMALLKHVPRSQEWI